MLIAVWIVTALLVALWSLLAWGVHALFTVDLKLESRVSALLEFPGSAWLDAWAPAWRELLLASAELVQTSMSWLGGVAPALVWGVWGLGSAGLVLCALVLSGVVSVARRALRSVPPAAASAGA